MNVIRLRKLLLLCFAIVILTPRFPAALSQNSGIIRVKEDFQTIQEAINNANPGDTIRVPAGIYYERLIVNKTVSLLGEGGNSTVIDGSNSGTVVEVTADNVIITGFKLQNSGYGWTRHGVYVYKANDCEIKANILYNTCHNIRLNYSRNSQVIGNTIDNPASGVTMYGIRLENSVNCIAADNNVTVRVGAIHLENATECTVTGNYLAKNDQGIRLYSPCVRNLIIENILEDNYYDGVISPMPGDATFTGNLFFHNNFLNNTNPFIIQSSGTIWDNGHEGNYWSRYAGVDNDQNGIGDSPYMIGPDRDNHPLMGPCSNFSVQSGGKTYSIFVISNSSINNFSYESASNERKVTLDVADNVEDRFFCRITLPTELMNPPLTALVDNNMEINATLKALNEDSDMVHVILYLSYAGGIHKIAVVAGAPSSSPLNIIPALLISSGIAAIILAFVTRKAYSKIKNKAGKSSSHRTFFQ